MMGGKDMDNLKSLVPVSYDIPERPTVSGRELHDFLEVTTRYNDWFNRMTEYGFTEGEDYAEGFGQNCPKPQRGR